MTKLAKIPADKTLPQFVGKRDVASALGVSIKTLDRRVADGEFPRPVKLSANRVGWNVDTVREHARLLVERVTARAVANPDDISDAKLPDALHALASRYVANHGHALGDDAFISVSRPLTPAESADLSAVNDKALADTLEAIAKIEVWRAWMMVAGLLPQLAPAAIVYFETISRSKVTLSPADLRSAALDILDQAVTGEFVGPNPP